MCAGVQRPRAAHCNVGTTVYWGRAMNVVLWLLAGAAVGWLGYSAFHLNLARGLVVSAIIGVGGAFFGGHVIAPLVASSDVAGAFNLLSLVVASASAMLCLSASDMFYERFGM